MRLLLGFWNSLLTHGCLLISNLIYIFIYMSKSAVLGIIFLVEFGQLGLVAIQATRAYFNKSPPWLELIKLHENIKTMWNIEVEKVSYEKLGFYLVCFHLPLRIFDARDDVLKWARVAWIATSPCKSQVKPNSTRIIIPSTADLYIYILGLWYRASRETKKKKKIPNNLAAT